ncbi:MAG TPA: helix-turn-helix transcriptional regulator [Steroidobacteraceae bacterium]|nr:helix-turn-helix transcriptional regulator [Steroidobacteraceae bacterium]
MERPDKGEAERKRLEHRIATVLKASREDLDVSRKELARRLRWKPEQVADLEIGRRVIRASDLIRIARALQMEPDELVRRIVRW